MRGGRLPSLSFSLSLGLILIINPSLGSGSSGREVRVVLRSQYGGAVESYGDECRAGVFFEKEQEFSCACVTGVSVAYSSNMDSFSSRIK